MLVDGKLEVNKSRLLRKSRGHKLCILYKEHYTDTSMSRHGKSCRRNSLTICWEKSCQTSLGILNFREVILEEVKQWVRELEQLYTNPGQMGACVRLTGNGCTGHVYPMNASNMTMDTFKVGFDELPIIKSPQTSTSKGSSVSHHSATIRWGRTMVTLKLFGSKQKKKKKKKSECWWSVLNIYFHQTYCNRSSREMDHDPVTRDHGIYGVVSC